MKFDLCMMQYGGVWRRDVEILSVDRSFLENTIDFWLYIMVVVDTATYTNDDSATLRRKHSLQLPLPLRTSFSAEWNVLRWMSLCNRLNAPTALTKMLSLLFGSKRKFPVWKHTYPRLSIYWFLNTTVNAIALSRFGRRSVRHLLLLIVWI